MHRIQTPIDLKTATSRDGTQLQVYVCGQGPHRMLLSPGAGTPLYGWKHLLEFFKDKLTIATWDQRGCYGSKHPPDRSHWAVEYNIEDADAVLATMGWQDKPFVAAGWSQGVQISLEVFDRHPEQVIGLCLINGAFEHVLRTVQSPLPHSEAVFEAILDFGHHMGELANMLTRALFTREWFITLLKNGGIVTDNQDFFAESLRDFKDLDFPFYSMLIKGLNRHSARHILPRVTVPALITAGLKDPMTPLSTAEEMHRLVPGSELFRIPNGTHYSLLEYPEIVNLKLDHFLRTRVFKDRWPD